MCLYLKLIFATASVWLSRTFIILAIMITPFWIILAQFKNVEEGEMPKLKTGREGVSDFTVGKGEVWVWLDLHKHFQVF